MQFYSYTHKKKTKKEKKSEHCNSLISQYKVCLESAMVSD